MSDNEIVGADLKEPFNSDKVDSRDKHFSNKRDDSPNNVGEAHKLIEGDAKFEKAVDDLHELVIERK